MNKKTIIIVSVIVLLFGWAFYICTRTNSSEIKNLYGQKGIIVEQKAELLKQKSVIDNQLSWINKEIEDIDQKLYKLINPMGLTKEGTSQTATVPTFQEIITLTWN